MFAPFRTYGSPLHTPMRHSRLIVRSDAFRTLRPVRSFVSTSRVEDVQRQRSHLVQRTLTFCRYSGYFLLSSAFGVLAIGAGIFIHDALTYTYKHVDRVPCNPQAFCPQKGGPNNLPVVKSLVDDDDDEEKRELAKKPRLIIVGGGWGAVAVLKTLHPGDYHVTLVATDTFNTFTPLLASAAVGTVQFRSLIEPLRKVIARLRGHFIHGKAVDLVMSERLLEVETVSGSNGSQRIYLPYDKLIIACGSTTNTHGVPGLEHCFQLKTIRDAQSIRRRIMDNFEAASQPTTTPEERKRLLSFVCCGGGPTGVETAAEIYDFCQEDIMKYYPKICREEVSIHVIQSRGHILNTYSEAISKYAENKFKRDEVDLVTNARVMSIHPDHVVFTTKSPEGDTIEHQIPTNFVLWSTGIAMNPFTQRVSSLLPNQANKKAIEVDAHLRVKGAPLGEVYAIGDCATIETSIVNHLFELVDEADRNKDGKIDFDELEIMTKRIKQRVPMAEDQLLQVRELFDLYDVNNDEVLSLNELAVLLHDIGNKITALPATAQVAEQEGKYLGKKFTKLARQRNVVDANGLPVTDDEAVYRPFRYVHMGNLAYLGNAAVFDMGKFSFMGGLAGMYAWRSVYWSKQVSARNRALLMIDWIVRGIWGRDLSKL